MRHRNQCTSPTTSTPTTSTPPPPSDPPNPPNAFSPDFLAEARERDDSLTASEAELSGPWKLEPVPGHPGWIAVLRESESQAEGDVPEAVFDEEDASQLCTVVLPLTEREPLYHLGSEADDAGLIPGGYPLLATHGEQGPRLRGWLRRYNPEIARGLHYIEGLNRAPAAHAVVLEAGGGGAMEKIGRALAARSRQR